ncbi:potassium/proton antiporter [soil metagenome]
MTFTAENILLIGSVLLFLSIVVSKTGYRFGIPSLLIFLFLGMLAGSDGIGKIYFDNSGLTQFLGVVALNFILFSGGMDTKFLAIKPILKPGLTLATVGVLITAIIIGGAAYYLLHFSLAESMLLGGVVSSTDAAAVFSILRSRSLHLQGNLKPMLELESGSNDPMAYFLTITFTALTMGEELSWVDFIWLFAKQIVIGGIAGYVFGKLAVKLINKIQLDIEGLYPVLLLAVVFFTYSFTNTIDGNGFLAVYIAGLVLGNADFVHKKSMLRFYDGQAWLLQIVMFLTLGLLVYPSQLPSVASAGLALAAVSIFLARPVAVFLCLLPFRYSFREMLFLSWVGLRGAVPIIFATYPLLAGVPQAHMIFNIVFFMTIASVAVQGTSLALVATWLGLVDNTAQEKSHEFELAGFNTDLIEISVGETCEVAGKALVDAHLPPNALIVLIKRGGKFVTPNGNTILIPGDQLMVMADGPATVQKVRGMLGCA